VAPDHLEVLHGERENILGLPERQGVSAGHDLQVAWQRVALLSDKLDAGVIGTDVRQRRMRCRPAGPSRRPDNGS
jgi:hypothetical protein